MTGKEDKLKKLLAQGLSQRAIALKLKVSRGTLARFIREFLSADCVSC